MDNRGAADFNVGQYFRITESNRPINRGTDRANTQSNIVPSYPMLSPAQSQIAPDFMNWSQNPASNNQSQTSLYYQTGIMSNPPTNIPPSSLEKSDESSTPYGSLASNFFNPNLSKPKGHSELYAKALAKKSELGLNSQHSAALEALRSYSPDNHSPPPPLYGNEKEVRDTQDILSKYQHRKSSSMNDSQSKEAFYVDESYKPLRSILKRGEDVLPSSSRSISQTSAPQPPRCENVDDEDKYLYGDSPEPAENVVVEPQNSIYSKWNDKNPDMFTEPEVIQVNDPGNNDSKTSINRSQPVRKVGKTTVPSISLKIGSSSSKEAPSIVPNEEIDDIMIIGTMPPSAHHASQKSLKNPSQKKAPFPRMSDMQRHLLNYVEGCVLFPKKPDKMKSQGKKMPINTGSKTGLSKRSGPVQQSSSITSTVASDVSSHVKNSFPSQSAGKISGDSEDKTSASMTFVPLALRKPPSLLKSDKVFEDAEERMLKKNSFVGKEDIFAEEITLRDPVKSVPIAKRNVTIQKKQEVKKKPTLLLPRSHPKIVKKITATVIPEPPQTDLFSDRTVRVVKKGKKLIPASKSIHAIKDPHRNENNISSPHHSKEVPHKHSEKYLSARYRSSERDHKHFSELVRSHSKERVRHRYSPSYSQRTREYSRSPRGSPYAHLSRSPKYKIYEQKSRTYSRSPERHIAGKHAYYKDKSPSRYYEKKHSSWSRSPTPDKYSESRSPKKWSRERSSSRDRARGPRYNSYSPSDTPRYDKRRRSYDHSPSDSSLRRSFKERSYERLHSPIRDSCNSPLGIVSDEKGDSDRDEKSYSRYSRRDIYEKEQKRTRESSIEKGSRERNLSKKQKKVPKLLDKALAVPNVETEKGNLELSEESIENNYTSQTTPLTAKIPKAGKGNDCDNFFEIISNIRNAPPLPVPTTSSQTSNVQSAYPPVLEAPNIPPPNIHSHNLLQTSALTYSQPLGYSNTSHLPVAQYSNVNNLFANHPVSTYSQNFTPHNYMEYDAYGVSQQQLPQSYFNMPQPNYAIPPLPHYLPSPIVTTEALTPVSPIKLKKPDSRRVCSLKEIPMGPDVSCNSITQIQHSEPHSTVTESFIQENSPKPVSKLKINISSQALKEKAKENPGINYNKTISRDEVLSRNTKHKFQDAGAKGSKDDSVHSKSYKEKRKEDFKTTQGSSSDLSAKAYQDSERANEMKAKELKHKLDAANENYQEMVKGSKGAQKSAYIDKLIPAREHLRNVLQEKEKFVAAARMKKVASVRASSSPSQKVEENIKKDKRVRKVRYADLDSYWCDFCNEVFPTVKAMLFHMLTDEHKMMDSEGIKHWADPVNEYNETGVDYIEAPLKGIQLMVPVNGFYCSLCQQCFPDQLLAEQHMKGRDHNDRYLKYCDEHPDTTQKYESRRARAVALFERDKKRKHVDALKGARKKIRSGLEKGSTQETENEADLKDNNEAEDSPTVPKKLSQTIVKFNFADKAKKKIIEEKKAEKLASQPIVYIGKNISMLTRLDSSKKKAIKTPIKTALADTSVTGNDSTNDSLSNNSSNSKSEDISDLKDKSKSSASINQEKSTFEGKEKSAKEVTVGKTASSENALIGNNSSQAPKDVISTTDSSKSNTNESSLSNIYGPSLPPDYMPTSKKPPKKTERKNMMQCKQPQKKPDTKTVVPLNEIMLPEEASKSFKKKEIIVQKITLLQEAPKPIPVIQMIGVKKNAVSEKKFAVPCNVTQNAEKKLAVPCNVTQNAEKKLAVPCNVTQNAEKKLAVPCNVQNAEKKLAVPCNVIQNAEKKLAVPCNVTQNAEKKLAVPCNVTQNAENKLAVPCNVTQNAPSANPPTVSNVPPVIHSTLSELDKDLLLLGINKCDIEPMVTPKRPPFPLKFLPSNSANCEPAFPSFPSPFYVPSTSVKVLSPAVSVVTCTPAVTPSSPVQVGTVFEKTENKSDRSFKLHSNISKLSAEDAVEKTTVAPSLPTLELSSPVLTHTESCKFQMLSNDSLPLAIKKTDVAFCQQSVILEKNNIIADVTLISSTTEVDIQQSEKNAASCPIRLKQMSENEVQNSTSINDTNVPTKVSKIPTDLKEKVSKELQSETDPVKIDSFTDALITLSDSQSVTEQEANDSMKNSLTAEMTAVKALNVDVTVEKKDAASKVEQLPKFMTQNSPIKEDASEVQNVELAELSTGAIRETQGISSLEKHMDILSQSPTKMETRKRDEKSVIGSVVQMQDTVLTSLKSVTELQQNMPLLQEVYKLDEISEYKATDLPSVVDNESIKSTSQCILTVKSKSEEINTMLPSKPDESPMEVELTTEIQEEISPKILLSSSTKEMHEDVSSLQKVYNVDEISEAKTSHSMINNENTKLIGHVLVDMPKNDKSNEALPPGSGDSLMKVESRFEEKMENVSQITLPLNSTNEMQEDILSLQMDRNNDSACQDDVQAAVTDNVMQCAVVEDRKMGIEITSTAQPSNIDISTNEVTFESFVEPNKMEEIQEDILSLQMDRNDDSACQDDVQAAVTDNVIQCALVEDSKMGIEITSTAQPANVDISTNEVTCESFVETNKMEESVLLKEALQPSVMDSVSSLVEQQTESSNLIPSNSITNKSDSKCLKPSYCETYIKHLLEDKEVEPACIIEMQKETLGRSLEGLVENIDNSLKNMSPLEVNENATSKCTQSILSDILSQIDEGANDSLDWVLSSSKSSNQVITQKHSIPKKTSKTVFSGLFIKPSVTSFENDVILNAVESVQNEKLQSRNELSGDFLQQTDAECQSEKTIQSNDHENVHSPKCPILIAEIASEINSEDESMKLENNVPQFQGCFASKKSFISAEVQEKNDENLMPMPELIAVLPIQTGEVIPEMGSILTATNAHEILSKATDLSQTGDQDFSISPEISECILACEDAPNVFQSTTNLSKTKMAGTIVNNEVFSNTKVDNNTSPASLEKDASLQMVDKSTHETPDAGKTTYDENLCLTKPQSDNSTFSEGPCILETLLTSDFKKTKSSLIHTSIPADKSDEGKSPIPDTVCGTSLVEEESQANQLARQIQEEAEKMFSAVKALAETELLTCGKEESSTSEISGEEQSSSKTNLSCITETPSKVINSTPVDHVSVENKTPQLETSDSRSSAYGNNVSPPPPSLIHDQSSNTDAMNSAKTKVILIDDDLCCSSPEPEIIFESVLHAGPAETFDVESSDDSCVEISPDGEVCMKMKPKKRKKAKTIKDVTSMGIENKVDEDKQDNLEIQDEENEKAEDEKASQSSPSEEVILPIKIEPVEEGDATYDPNHSLSSLVEFGDIQKNIKTEKCISEETYSVPADFPISSVIKTEKSEVSGVSSLEETVNIKQERVEAVKKEPKTESDDSTDEYDENENAK